jgi:hypothetical protein
MLYLRLIILSVGCDVSINSEIFWMTDFVNLNIKPAQSFRSVHRDKMYIYVFIEMNIHTYISICVYTVFLKKHTCFHRVVAQALPNDRCTVDIQGSCPSCPVRGGMGKNARPCARPG